MHKVQREETLPLIAILRGVSTQDVLRIAHILIDEGFRIIEVPLNSPNALESIRLLVNQFGDDYLIGAGTVTNIIQAKDVVETGAKLIVTPNMNRDVIMFGRQNGCEVYPGVVTPTEAFTALQSGATGLKLFPISMVGIDGLKALKSVLPKGTLCFPVGGINPTFESMEPYCKAGADGFGLGSALYKPSMSDEEIRLNAQNYVDNFIKITNKERKSVDTLVHC
ncbi:2-dehydro-3-deoxy-6-phosphogalactonate aldolase [Vibrio sp.]|nr:2-dehydro-3-deoxy-6-phosphogalactonate aldolase [Vibrio sp.]